MYLQKYIKYKRKYLILKKIFGGDKRRREENDNDNKDKRKKYDEERDNGERDNGERDNGESDNGESDNGESDNEESDNEESDNGESDNGESDNEEDEDKMHEIAEVDDEVDEIDEVAEIAEIDREIDNELDEDFFKDISEILKDKDEEEEEEEEEEEDEDEDEDEEEEEDEEEDEEAEITQYFGKTRFIISAHGSTLSSLPTIKYFKIPTIDNDLSDSSNNNINIYFETLCTIDNPDSGSVINQYEDITACKEKEFYDNFKVATDTENDDFIGYKYANKFTSGSIIKDCILNCDRKYNDIEKDGYPGFVINCDKEFEQRNNNFILKFIPNEEYFLSNIIILIKEYAIKNNIKGPYNIYCSFCINEDEVNNENIIKYSFINNYMKLFNNDISIIYNFITNNNYYVSSQDFILSERIKD